MSLISPWQSRPAADHFLKRNDSDFFKVRGEPDDDALHMQAAEAMMLGREPTAREKLFAFHQEATARMFAICQAKNADYAGQGEAADPFANFRRVEVMGIATTEQGFLTRMVDKVSRLTSLTAPGAVAKVTDESVEDTLMDLANYCILLAAYRRTKA
jgi:hypothetical protein